MTRWTLVVNECTVLRGQFSDYAHMQNTRNIESTHAADPLKIAIIIIMYVINDMVTCSSIHPYWDE